MAIENWSEHVLLVSPMSELQTGDDLADVADRVSTRRDFDVVVDCSSVDHLGCSTWRQLLELDDVLRAQGHRLVLCGAKTAAAQPFAMPVLAGMRRCSEDRSCALARLGLSSR